MIRFSDCVSWQTFDNTVYVINEVTQTAFIMEDVSKDFWMAIEKYGESRFIIDEIVNNYSECDSKLVQEDFELYLLQLIEHGLAVMEG